MKIALASDHAGFERKQDILEYLESENIDHKDFGCFSDESTDYADWAHPMADAVEKGNFEYGISICGSGNGINMTVNKHQKVRSALCWSVEIAELARLHNDANVLSIPGRFVTKKQAIDMVKIFLSTKFEGGRHERRINKIPLK